DLELATSYLSALRKLKKSLNIKENVKLSHLLIFPDILKIKKNSSEKLQNLIIEAIEGALDDLIKSKEKEGEVHLREIKKHLKKIKSSIDRIKKEFPVAQKRYMEKIQEEMKKLPTKESLVPFLNSTTSKIPLFLTKGDIEEEIVRFYSHLEEFEKTLKRKTPVGKKLAFILQELAREINTIGAKSLSSTISQEVVQIKECIEKIREQISNIE
ncbi:DUF1732 domain-containing protein, partial [Candidatus Aerophobetes bacterium]|nr:DUF1732 domain-containing protein [Candidatus Aerophobetes bacterium]